MRHFERNWHNYRFRCNIIIDASSAQSSLHFLVLPRPTFLRVELDFQHGKNMHAKPAQS